MRLANGEAEPDDEGKERDDRLKRECSEKATSTARARALRLDQDLSKEAFDEKLLDFDGKILENDILCVLTALTNFFFCFRLHFDIIEFVTYDEEVYNFVKDGETTKNRYNRLRKNGEPCCLARIGVILLTVNWKKMIETRKQEGSRFLNIP